MSTLSRTLLTVYGWQFIAWAEWAQMSDAKWQQVLRHHYGTPNLLFIFDSLLADSLSHAREAVQSPTPAPVPAETRSALYPLLPGVSHKPTRFIEHRVTFAIFVG